MRAPALARVAVVAAAVPVLAAACSYLRDEGPEPFRPPGVRADVPAAGAGRALYERDCAWCHGAAGQGTVYGPDLDGPGDGGAYTHFMLATGRMPLRRPSAEAATGPSRYSEAEIAAIVAHVETFGGTGPDVPSPDPAAGDLARGAELYLENCAACHAATGAGGALTSGQVVPDVHGVSARVVAEAALVGPGCPNDSPSCGPGEGAMPRFAFDGQDLDDLVAYVSYLQDPRDEGGAPIGRIGPVAEGAVALLLGVGLLLVVSRWIGTREGR